MHQLQCRTSGGGLSSCSWANVDLTIVLCCVAGWCQNWASGSGRSGYGFLSAWAGPTWRIGKGECTLKLATCGWRYPSHCCFSSFGKSLRGQCVSFCTILIKLPHLERIQQSKHFSFSSVWPVYPFPDHLKHPLIQTLHIDVNMCFPSLLSILFYFISLFFSMFFSSFCSLCCCPISPMWGKRRPSILLYSLLFYTQMSTFVGGLLLCTHFTQFLFPVVYLCFIRHSIHQCFYGFSLCFVASLFVFCLVASLLLISSLHLKAPEGLQCKQHYPVKSNGVHIIKRNYLKFWGKPLTTVLSDSNVTLLLHEKLQSCFFFLI